MSSFNFDFSKIFLVIFVIPLKLGFNQGLSFICKYPKSEGEKIGFVIFDLPVAHVMFWQKSKFENDRKVSYRTTFFLKFQEKFQNYRI